MSTKYTENELGDLTDAEREALLDGGEEDGNSADELEIQGLGEGNVVDATNNAENQAAKGDDGAAAAVDAVADAGAAATTAAEPDATAAAEVAGNEPPAAPLQVQPVFVASAPDDADAKLAELDERRTKARADYNNGDIDHDAYEALKDQIGENKMELKLAINTARISAEMAQQAQMNAWYAEANGFANAKGYNANTILYKAFETVVVDVAKSEAGATMTPSQILAEAHKLMVAAGLGKADGAVAAPAKAAPKAAKPAQPPNLALVPAAATESTESGKYTALEALQRTNPDAYEEALLKMTDAQQDAYLRAVG